MIGKLLKLLFAKGLTIKRWNNFPRVEDVTPLDNTGFVIHTSLFLTHLEEKKGKKIDKEFIIKRIIFNLFSSLVLADINSGTRNYINQIDGKIMGKLEKKVFNYLKSFEGGDFIKEEMEEILSDNSKKIELKIIEAAKKYAGLEEVLVNSRVFPYAYDVPKKQISEELEKEKNNLFSLKELLENNKYKNYLGHIRRLSHSMRWSGKQRKYPISVMSHLVITSFIVYILGNIENKNGEKYDISDLIYRTIYHDIPEMITGDIITPTKGAIEGFRDILEQAEQKMMDDYFFIYISPEYKKEISNYMLDPFSGKQGKLGKQADIISALLESRIERDGANSSFNNIYMNIKKVLNKSEYYSTNLFLKNILIDFGEDIYDVDLREY